MTLTNQYPSLKYKVVLITGGASGIGANLVEAFCYQGAQVCFIDIRDEDAHKLAEQLSHRPDNIPPRYYRCNLLNIPKLQATIKQIYNDVGPINVLINNAAND
ncbi:MAG TPA: SDR family NAD(P)-dependent oxidoreductase, partial [Cellvibrio sp.]|nr:SDR family NAD(P)-dependent oxidoreductase [Cellvibrio sp.]